MKPILILFIVFGLYANAIAWTSGTQEVGYTEQTAYYYYNR